MNVKAFESIIETEQSAQSYLRGLCWKGGKRYCLRCRSSGVYSLAGKRYRCKRCNYTFHDLSKRWINKCKISYRNWLLIVRLFEKDLTAKHISKQVDISYPTILKALEVIRLSIIANSEDAETWLSATQSKTLHRRKKEKPIYLYGIIEKRGKVKIKFVESVSLDSLASRNPKPIRRSSIYYTEAYPPYTFLVFQNSKRMGRQRKVIDKIQPHPINGQSDFWRYAKNNILKHHGIAKGKLPQYLKELEFRYNHRNQATFELLCRYLVSIIPEG